MSRPTSRLAPALAVLLLVGCSDDGGLTDSGADLSSADFLLHDGQRDGAVPDGALPSCAPGTELLARVDQARMLKDLQYLVGLGERRSHANQTKAATYLKGELGKLGGIKLREHGYTYGGEAYVNLEVTIDGVELPDEFIFAGAHYDSMSPDPNNAPGADDDASGTVAILEIARAMAGCRPRRSVRLLLFSNEEKGIIGSKAYVSSIKASLPTDKLLGMISVDMVAYGSATEDLDLATKPEQKTFVDDVAAAVEQHTSLKVKKIISDHCG